MTWNLGLETIRRHWAIVLVLAAFFALGITYSVITPLFEAPDELQHYARIKRLAEAIGAPEIVGLPAAGTLAFLAAYVAMSLLSAVIRRMHRPFGSGVSSTGSR